MSVLSQKPLYRGCRTLGDWPTSRTRLRCFHIGLLILLKNDQPADEKSPLSAAYGGPVEPETPILKFPRRVLHDVGIARYQNPHAPGWEPTGNSE
jgi:hypothetical protein